MKQTLLKKSLLLSAAITTVALSASARQPERGYRGFVDWTNRIERSTFVGMRSTFLDITSMDI